MSKIVFSNEEGVDGEIQLRDGEFFDVWKMIFSKNNSALPLRTSNVRSTVISKKLMQLDTWIDDRRKQGVHSYIENMTTVNAGIDTFKAAGYSWDLGYLTLHSTFEDTNRIHRGFTTSMLTRGNSVLNITEAQRLQLKHMCIDYNHPHVYFVLKQFDDSILAMHNIEPNAQFGYSYFEQQAHRALFDINTFVHRIEDSSFASARYFNMNNSYMEECWNGWEMIACPSVEWESKGPDATTDAIKVDYNYGITRWNTPDMFSSDPKYNVYDLKNILGKDMVTGYQQYDDPREWDITNTFNTTKGGFEIQPWTSYYHTQYIKPWCRRYNSPDLDKITAPIALGTIDPRWIQQHCVSMHNEDAQPYIISQVDLIE